jgi:hypothetical protein
MKVTEVSIKGFFKQHDPVSTSFIASTSDETSMEIPSPTSSETSTTNDLVAEQLLQPTALSKI